MENFEIARVNMVKNQIMPNNVSNESILAAFMEIPRHEFVEGNWRSIAYSDARLPVSNNRELLAPDVLARMISALTLSKKHTVLDCACATGYASAVLAKVSKHVVAIEVDEDLIKKAQKTVVKLGITNVEFQQGKLLEGYKKSAPYDAILVAGCLDAVPEKLIEQLKVDGKLAYIKRVSGHLCKATLVQNLGHTFGEIELFDTFCKPLK
jgi:protein-L-isoaspartate(D-aspartate) O-methyltransferase